MAGSIDPGISALIRDHARAVPSLPVTCWNSNIAGLDLGAEAGISMPAVRHASASWISSVRAIQTIIIVTLAAARLIGGRNELSHPADVATYRTLNTASMAAPALRAGLDSDSADAAVRYLRSLLGADAVAL